MSLSCETRAFVAAVERRIETQGRSQGFGQGGQQSFNLEPRGRGAPEPKFVQNMGFPLKLPENCMILKKFLARGPGPQDTPTPICCWYSQKGKQIMEEDLPEFPVLVVVQTSPNHDGVIQPTTRPV